MKYTFFYIVGGDDKYYYQLERSIRSLNRCIKAPFKIKILDIGKKLKSSANIEVIYINRDITKKQIFWQYKYYLCQNIDTEYGIYLDCDTVVCSDPLDDVFKKIGEKFGLVNHFYIKDFKDFLSVFPNEKTFEYIRKFNISLNNLFFTGGVFFFKNTKKNIIFLKDVFDLHFQFYKSDKDEYIEGLYDETFISTIFSNHHVNLNGAMNHCSANYMPLKIKNDELWGKNPQDENFEKVFVLHGSSDRQIQGLDFYEDIKSKIKKAWDI